MKIFILSVTAVVLLSMISCTGGNSFTQRKYLNLQPLRHEVSYIDYTVSDSQKKDTVAANQTHEVLEDTLHYPETGTVHEKSLQTPFEYSPFIAPKQDSPADTTRKGKFVPYKYRTQPGDLNQDKAAKTARMALGIVATVLLISMLAPLVLLIFCLIYLNFINPMW